MSKVIFDDEVFFSRCEKYLNKKIKKRTKYRDADFFEQNGESWIEDALTQIVSEYSKEDIETNGIDFDVIAQKLDERTNVLHDLDAYNSILWGNSVC